MEAVVQSLPQKFPLSAFEISAAELSEQLSAYPTHALVFTYNGHEVLPGYHVTEVKIGAFRGLDCGANYESWEEVFIQLWDVPADDGRTFMPVRKFLAILEKVASVVKLDPTAKLTFEVSDGRKAMELMKALSFEVAGDKVTVVLGQRPSSCKPRDRWLEQQEAKASCCAPAEKCCA